MILGVTSDFPFKFGCIWYYVMRSWILFKVSVLAGLF